MIPVKLSIQGLYSYQEKQTIDFTKLTAANLFGIFGTVGCGKSSILEAITFAIYGRTSRLNLSGDNRYYNMMNLKSNELFIDFIFETGKEQTSYRSKVKGKRNNKNFEEVKALDRSAYKQVNQEWIPVETEELERAIGLSYDNFRRTIIIPQGQFQEFLQLGNKDRTQMMNELFNLGKFEFYKKVTSLETKNNAAKQTIEGKLLQLGEIDAEKVISYQEQLALLKKELEKLEFTTKKLKQQEDEMKQLQVLTEKLKDTEQALNLLRMQEPEMKKREKAIGEYEQCIIQFKHLIDSLESSSQRMKNKENQVLKDKQELEHLGTEFGFLEKQLAEIKPAYEKKEEIKKRAEELGLLLKIINQHSRIEEYQERQKKGQQILNKTIQNIESLKIDKSTLEALIKAQKQSLPDMAVLADVKAWHVEKERLENQLQETENQIDKYKLEKARLGKELSIILADQLFEKLKDKTNLTFALNFLSENSEVIKQQSKLLELEANELGIKARLQQFAGELKEGNACPLCGSLSHPEVYSAVDILESQNRLKELKEKKANHIDRIQEMVTRLNDLNNQLKFNACNLNDWHEKRGAIVGKQKVKMDLFKWDKYSSKEELKNAFSQSALIQSKIKEVESELEENSSMLEKEQKNKDRFQAGLEKITNDLIAGQTETRTLQEQLVIVKPEQYIKRTISEIEKEKDELNKQYNRLEELYGTLSKQIEKNRKAATGLEGGLEVNLKELIQEQSDQQQLKIQAEEQLKKSMYQSLEDVKKILTQPIAPEQEKQKLEAFKQHLAFLEKQSDQLQKEIGNRIYMPDIHIKIKSEIESYNQVSGQKNQAMGKTAELLKKLQQDLENQERLQLEHNKLELRAENIRTMKSLFKASGFVNYISSVYLQNLCNSANERFFQLTRQKMSLEITADNNFQVRDFMNGGKVRSVKTLSGGQTFQAALSLALALADNIQKITESNQNFFFLDEGFGSLDKESLAVVFDTLKTLRKENRTVGVISHVEEMQQEIDMYLRIENKEEKGSIILPCWMS